ALEKRHFEVAERLLRESDINVDVKVGGKSVKDYVEGLKTFYTDDVNKKKIEKIAQRIEVRLAEQETKVKDFETPGELKTAMTKLSGKWTEWIKKLFGGNDLMASVNDENQINELIECVDIDETFCIGDSGPKLTALQHAARLGNRKLVDHLLGKGASVTHCGADGKTALMLAMENGNISIVNALIAKADSSNQLLDMRDNKGKTALMYAVEKGWTDGVKALLEAGASPIALDNTNESVLSCAVRRPLSDPTEIDSLIQKAQEVINVPNKSGETPLHVAAREGCTAWIDKLLVGGADVNARDRGKLTALALALKEKHFDVAERLLQEPDIDVDVKVEDGESVKDHAEKLQNSSNGAVKQSVASLVRDINSRLAQQKKERQEIEDQKTAKKAKEQVEAELKTAQDELTVTKAGAEQAVFELNQQKIEAEKIQNALTSLAQKLDDAHIDISQLDNSERLAQFEIEDNTRRLWSLLCEENKPTNWEKDAVELIESGNIDLNRYNSVEKGLVGQKDETVVEVTPLAYAMGAVNGPYFSIMEALLAHQDNVNMSCPAMGDGFHGYTPLDFAFQRKEVFDRNDRFRSVVKLLVQILGSRGTLPANADVWEWLQHQDSADMEDVRRMLSEILRKQARRSGAYGRSTSETGRLSEENARLAAEKEDLEAKLDTLSHENLQLTDQIEKLLGKKYKLEAGKTLDVEENREPQEGQELQENVSQKTKKRSKLDADPRIIQGESKDVEEEKEPLSDGSAAEAENEALRNQIKQLQDEIARRSEAVNPKKGLSEIAITPNKASESAEKPEEDSNQENVAVDKPLEEKIPVPEEKDPEAKEVKAFVENNQIKIDVGQFLLDNLSPPVSADNTQNKSMGKVSVRFGQSNVGSHSSLANRPTPEARSQLNANGIPHGRAAALMCQRIMKMLGRSKQKELFVMLKKSETQQGQQALIKIFRILQKIRQNGRRNVPLISSLPSSEAMNFRVGGFPPVKSSGPNPQQSVVPEQKPQLIYESGVRQ
ncbi:MAG: ankyrin repeat domain-containing protein, partial [Puniceicoccales bacterium]|nr:ankyrin repeat domain-containing protein [Puniceicoccales bacterium]